jgi:hypothetical protein
MTTKEDYTGIQIFAEELPSFLPAPAGIHVARCVSFFQLGTQKTEFEGKSGKDRPKIMLEFEIPGEQIYFIRNTYTLIISDKSTLKLHVESWTKGKINKEFDFFTLLGKPCQVEVEQNQNKNDATKMDSKLIGIYPLEKDQECPPQVTPSKVLVFQRWDQETFESLPDWMQKEIEKSPEFKSMGLPMVAGNKEGVFNEKENPVDPYPIGADGLPF